LWICLKAFILWIFLLLVQNIHTFIQIKQSEPFIKIPANSKTVKKKKNARNQGGPKV
jgi:hypothetical protein